VTGVVTDDSSSTRATAAAGATMLTRRPALRRCP
jgi:hypothetical protein